jgi:hypothetical protein
VEQGEFTFDEPERKIHPEHPTAILAWRDGGVVRDFAEFPRMETASFSSWPEALASVCHPLNDHIYVRVCR